MLFWTLLSFLLQVLLGGFCSVLNHIDRVKVPSILYKFQYVLGDFLCFSYFNYFVKKSNSGSFRKLSGWFDRSPKHDLFSFQQIARLTFILTSLKHLYASPFFHVSGWLHGHCLCSISPKEEKERSVSQSVYLNLLQALKFKPKCIFNWIYFFKGEWEPACALILFLLFQVFDFKLFILPLWYLDLV